MTRRRHVWCNSTSSTTFTRMMMRRRSLFKIVHKEETEQEQHLSNSRNRASEC